MRPATLASLGFAVAFAAAACGNDDAGDSKPPTVVETFPADGGTARVTEPITATFSEAMDEETLTSATFVVSSGATIVPGSVSYEGRTATFTLDSALVGFSPYTVELSTEITDRAGNALESPFTWSFTSSTGLFTLSSAELSSGGTFAGTNTCDSTADTQNESPSLTWSEGPPGTAGYAIVFSDLSNTLIHWVLWDIPLGVRSLAAAVPTVDLPDPPGGGAKQALSYDGTTYGYLGPCPGGATHTYEFVVYAMDTAMLPTVTTLSTRVEVAAAIKAHDLGSASLSGTSNASP